MLVSLVMGHRPPFFQKGNCLAGLLCVFVWNNNLGLAPAFKSIWKSVWTLFLHGDMVPKSNGPMSHSSGPQGLWKMTVFKIGNASRTDIFSVLWERVWDFPRPSRHSCAQTKLRNIMENSIWETLDQVWRKGEQTVACMARFKGALDHEILRLLLF